MKKLTLFVVAAFAVACAFANSNEMKEVVITGKVLNINEKTSKAIKFNFFNILTDGSQTVKLDEKNEFVVRQEMLYTQSINAHYLNYFITLYVQPGDSVHLTIDAALLDKGNYQWLTITGDHASASTQLNRTIQYLYTLPSYKYDYSVVPDSMLILMKNEYKTYLTSLERFAKANGVEHLVLEWAKKDLRYLVSYNASDYGTMKEDSHADKQAKTKVFGNEFFDTYNANNFQSMWYPYHLTNYARSISQGRDTTILTDINENRPVAAIRKKTALILKEPAGETRDYMLYYILSSMAKNYPGILDSLPDLDSYFSTTVYKKHLHKAAIIKKPVFKDTPISGISYISAEGGASAVPETDVFSLLKAKYPGKVLYIDVYATWCGPCLVEFEKAPALHEAMTGKDVVFVNLCLQSTASAWKKLLIDKKLKGENYFFDNDATKLFMGVYKLLGYPSYILVDKNGEIASTSAPRPSDPRLKSTLTKLLE